MESKKILLVDDVKFNIDYGKEIIQSVVEKVGIKIEIDTAHTVEKALAKIAENERYDAMIIDMNLPDGSGVHIAKVALKKSERTRIAALTIYPSKYKNESCFFDLFLRKPLAPEDYRQGFRHLLRC